MTFRPLMTFSQMEPTIGEKIEPAAVAHNTPWHEDDAKS
jgi:hypothetical protein